MKWRTCKLCEVFVSNKRLTIDHKTTRTLKGRPFFWSIQLNTTFWTRACFHLILFTLLLQILQALHSKRMIRNVHQTIIKGAHPTHQSLAKLIPIRGQVEKLQAVLNQAMIEGIIKAEVSVFEITNAEGIHRLVFRYVVDYIRDKALELGDMVQELNHGNDPHKKTEEGKKKTGRSARGDEKRKNKLKGKNVTKE